MLDFGGVYKNIKMIDWCDQDATMNSINYGDLTMSNDQNPYGLPQTKNRPKVKATKKLDLSGNEGQQIIKSETKLTLRTHQKTFKKLADM